MSQPEKTTAKMMGRTRKSAVQTALWLLAGALAVLLLLLAGYVVQGSLEQFPTDEQQGKTRIGALLGFVVLAVLEIAVVVKAIRSAKPKTLR